MTDLEGVSGFIDEKYRGWDLTNALFVSTYDISFWKKLLFLSPFGVFIQLILVLFTRHCPPIHKRKAETSATKSILDDAYLAGHG